MELAVLAELLLRGPQTEGDLRARASRMEPLPDLAALQTVLEAPRSARLGGVFVASRSETWRDGDAWVISARGVGKVRQAFANLPAADDEVERPLRSATIRQELSAARRAWLGR